eukprot:NODE_44_length_33449_cov_1.575742.p35 type:complete len:109 gc:universal NODE_44_length_33449_cov_1.575742:6140-6466(+)
MLPRRILKSAQNVLQFVRMNAENTHRIEGMAYPAKILKQMPFGQLHELYYALLKERNALETMKLNCKLKKVIFLEKENLEKVKLSMRRVLHTVSERQKLPKETKSENQ